jgi:hypothetical protein
MKDLFSKEKTVYYFVLQLHHYDQHSVEIVEIPKYSEEILELVTAIVKEVDNEFRITHIIKGNLISEDYNYNTSFLDFCKDYNSSLSTLLKYALEKLDELLSI